MMWLNHIYALKEFSGDKTLGIRSNGFACNIHMGINNSLFTNDILETEADEIEKEAYGGPELDENDDEIKDNIGGMVDFISALTLS